MNSNDLIRTSKFLSLILRHAPEKAGLTLDSQGWVEVDRLLAAVNRKGHALTLDGLKQVVAGNDKKRFAFSDDGLRIRASQGHSVGVDLGYSEQVPPERLYHGTATRFQNSIMRQGLLKGSRTHVHLSHESSTARKVGSRHGTPVILVVEALKMHQAGFKFFLSANNVWLTDHVPAKFISTSEYLDT